MKSILTTLLSLGFLIGLAQINTEKASALTNNFNKHLSLTTQQAEKVKNLISKKLNLIAELKTDKDTEKANVSIMLEKRKFFTELKEILTEEQFNAYQVLRSEQSIAINSGEKVENPIIDSDLDMLIKK